MTKTAPKPGKAWTGETGEPHKWLVAFETITVSTYADGEIRATHGRLDKGSNRMVFAGLRSPEEVWCEHGSMAHYLAHAAVEYLQDTHDQGTLF